MSTYRIPALNNIKPELVELGWFGEVRFDPDDSLPNYIGLNTVNGADTSVSDWKLYKLTYSGLNITRVQLAYSSWDGRANAF